MADNDNIIQINIEDEMKTAYIDYSMSVIVSRAIPDVRDGLHPYVHVGWPLKFPALVLLWLVGPDDSES